jgi:GNAT superfamily N-acetyltransferase
MSLSIRAAAPNDAALIHRYICDLASYEKLRHLVKATPESLAHQLFAPHPKVFALIGEIDSQPQGFAIYFFNFSTFEGRPGLYLEDLYVDPAARGSGLGKALLKRLAHLAIESECARLEFAVLDWNEPALQFYRSLGAQPMHEWTTQRLDGPALQNLAKE